MQALRRGAPAWSALYTIVFRPAAMEKLDGNMAGVNIPLLVSKASDQSPGAYYFGSMRQVLSHVVHVWSCIGLYFDVISAWGSAS